MIETIKKNKISFILILLFLVIAVRTMMTTPASLTGDGIEYEMQVVAFSNHFSFGITPEDLEQAKAEFYNEAELMDYEYFVDLAHHLHEYKGAKYSNHYGMYSAMVAPFKLLLSPTGCYPIRAFHLTNLLLYLSALLVVFFCLKIDETRKLILIILGVANPAWFYMFWTHTEVYMFAFTVIGLVFYYNRSYARAILFISIAAMQNLSVLAFAMVIGVQLLVESIGKHIEQNGKFDFGKYIKAFAKEVLPCGLCYIPALIPMISTYIRFNTINLVADNAMENKYLFSKAMNYLFDLNLGILPFEPFILAAFVVVAVIGLKKNTLRSIVNILGVGGILFIIAHQIQINSGMNFIMRYNIWIVQIMIFFVVCCWDVTFGNNKTALALGIVQGLWTAFILIMTLSGRWAYSANQFAPWTKVVMNRIPAIYNPTRGIFYSRAKELECYYEDYPAVYTNDKGQVRKILLSRDAEDVFFSDQWILCDGEGNRIDKTALKSVSVDEGDYRYINMTGDVYHVFSREIENPVIFAGSDYNLKGFYQQGMAKAENEFTWTDGDAVTFKVSNDSPVQDMHCYIDVATVFYQPQHVNVYVDDDQVFSGVIENGDQDIEFDFTKPEDNIFEITMELPDSIQPYTVIDSEDPRDLGLALISMTISDAADY